MSRLLIGRVACEKKEKRWPKLIRPSLVSFISIRLSAAWPAGACLPVVCGRPRNLAAVAGSPSFRRRLVTPSSSHIKFVPRRRDVYTHRQREHAVGRGRTFTPPPSPRVSAPRLGSRVIDTVRIVCAARSVKRWSVRLSRRSTAAAASGGFAA